ncbi:MAG: flavodoxin family protein [Deltaproteobacteria bacterium]|nr:flavodoxin family protein [Deltaproteobacteria bacterium]
MKLLGIYGSPREGGNSDLLLNEALKGAESIGAEAHAIRSFDLNLSGCRECGGCDKTGKCVIKDDMDIVYPQLLESEVIILASPMFFYGITSSAKALIDRCQALWNRRMLEKPPDRRRQYDSGRGYMIAVGATKGANLFEGSEMVAKYFFDALDKSYEGGLFVRSVEKKTAISERPDILKEAFELGKAAILGKKFHVSR